MRRIFWICVMAVMMATGQGYAERWDALAGLARVIDDEERAIDRLRAFDVAQQRLVDWDIDIARRMQPSDPLVTTTKMEDAERRITNLRKAYEEFFSHYPKNARARTYYGELLYDRFGEIAGAVQNWKMAEHLDEKLALPLNDLATHYCNNGDYQLGLRYFERALKIEPRNPDFLFNLTQAYLSDSPQVKRFYKWDDARLYREAMETSRKAMEADPEDFELAKDYAVNFFAAERFGIQADWGKAAAAWRRSRELARTDDERFYTWLNEARVSLFDSRADHAVSCLEEALRIRPQSIPAQRLLEKAQGGSGS